MTDHATKGIRAGRRQDEIYLWYPPALDGAADEPRMHEAVNG